MKAYHLEFPPDAGPLAQQSDTGDSVPITVSQEVQRSDYQLPLSIPALGGLAVVTVAAGLRLRKQLFKD